MISFLLGLALGIYIGFKGPLELAAKVAVWFEAWGRKNG